jgi:hypothetical protein
MVVTATLARKVPKNTRNITRMYKVVLDEQLNFGISSVLLDHLSITPAYTGFLTPPSEQEMNT